MVYCSSHLSSPLYRKFYDTLAKRAADRGQVIDIFAACLDQVGLLEMKTLVNYTNGFMILSDSFAMEIFKKTFQERVFNKDERGLMNMAFNATLEVTTTRELKVCGLIGPAVSNNKKSSCIGETVKRGAEVYYLQVIKNSSLL